MAPVPVDIIPQIASAIVVSSWFCCWHILSERRATIPQPPRWQRGALPVELLSQIQNTLGLSRFSEEGLEPSRPSPRRAAAGVNSPTYRFPNISRPHVMLRVRFSLPIPTLHRKYSEIIEELIDLVLGHNFLRARLHQLALDDDGPAVVHTMRARLVAVA
jgi:hypothetical protein